MTTPLMVFAYYHPSRLAAIYANLDQSGIVTFAIEVDSASSVRGTELFRRMMLAFGSDVKAIQGVWRKGKNPSINIDKVNELTAQGMAIEDAVLHAWTVTRAKKLSFGKVRIIDQVGSPGAYTSIDVMIEK